MADSNDLEKLFLLEILVDYVAYNCDDKIKGLKETCVTFKFLNYPSISICEEDFAENSHKYDDKEVCFNSGKSCLFSLHGKFLTKNVDLEVTVSRKNDKGECVKIGRSCVPLGSSFVNLFENAPVEMSEEPKSKTVRDHYPFFDEQNNTIGKLGVLVRLSCFGPLIVTQFEIKSPSNEEFVFTNNSTKLQKQRSFDGPQSATSDPLKTSGSNYPAQSPAFPPAYYTQKSNYQSQSQYGGVDTNNNIQGTGLSSNRVCQPCSMQVPTATPFSSGCPCGEEQMQEMLGREIPTQQAFSGQKCGLSGQFPSVPPSQEFPPGSAGQGFSPYGRGFPSHPPSRGFPTPSNQGFPPTPNQGFPPTPNQGFPSTPNQGFPPTPNQGFPPTPNQGFPPTPNQGFPPTPPSRGFPPPFPGTLSYPPQLQRTQMEGQVPNMCLPPSASSPQLTPAGTTCPIMPSYRPQTSTGLPQGVCDRTTCPEFLRSQGQGNAPTRPQSAFPQIPLSPCYQDPYNRGCPGTWPMQERYPGAQPIPNSINTLYSLQNIVPPSAYPRQDGNQIKTQSADALFHNQTVGADRLTWLIDELEKSGPRKGDIIYAQSKKDGADTSAPGRRSSKQGSRRNSKGNNESRRPSDPTLFEVPADLRGPRPGDLMCWGGKVGQGPPPGVRAIWSAEEVKGEPDQLCWIGREVTDNEIRGVFRPEKESSRIDQTIWSTKPGEPLPPITPQSQKAVDFTSRVMMPRQPEKQVYPSKIQSYLGPILSCPALTPNQQQMCQQMQQYPGGRGDPGLELYYATQGQHMMGQFPPPMGIQSRSMGNLVGPSMGQPGLTCPMSCCQLPTVSSISLGGTPPIAPGGDDSDDSSSSDSDDGKFSNLQFCDCDIPLPPGFHKSKSKKKNKCESEKTPPICAVTCGDPRCCLNKFTTSEYKCTRIATQGSTGKLAYLANQAVFNTGLKHKNEPVGLTSNSTSCPTYAVSNNPVSRPQLVQVVDPLNKTKEDVKNDTFLLNVGKTDCSGKPAKLNLTFKTPKILSQICTNDSAIQCVPEAKPKKEKGKKGKGKKGKGKKDKGKKGKKGKKKGKGKKSKGKK